MKLTSKSLLCAATALYAAGTSFATVSRCLDDSGGVCFEWGVPEGTQSAGSGNVYFQISAPTSMSWVGLGIGDQMPGSDVFVVYANGTGGVTISPRHASARSEPQYMQDASVELLEGSGIVDGRMVANVRCSSCNSLDMSQTNPWIAAWREGEPLDSTSPEETISVHTGRTILQFDMADASIDSDENPFSSSTPGSGDDDDDDDDDGDDGANGDDNGVDVVDDDSGVDIALVHGIVMSIVFLGGYPLGAVLMPLLGRWLIHATWQTLVFLAMWAGFGLGYVYANDDGIFFDEAHTRLGTIVCALLGIQPILGWLHHQHYRKHQSRGIISHVHIWYGRILMALGIINGGLGIRLSGSSDTWRIAYSVVAGVVAAAYVFFVVVQQLRHRRRARQVEKPSGASPAMN